MTPLAREKIINQIGDQIKELNLDVDFLIRENRPTGYGGLTVTYFAYHEIRQALETIAKKLDRESDWIGAARCDIENATEREEQNL
jgi:hypothetical protein